MTRKTLALLVSGVAAVAAVAVVSSAVGAGAPPPRNGSEPPSVPTTTPVRGIQADQASLLQALRRPRSVGDALPVSIRQTLAADDKFTRSYGGNVDLARRVSATAQKAAWIIPGDGKLCVAIPDSTGFTLNCATPAEVRDGYLQPSLVGSTGRGTLTGILPDGVSSVRLVNRDGSQRTVEVSDNFYAAAIDAELLAVEYIDPKGREQSRPMGWVPPPR